MEKLVTSNYQLVYNSFSFAVAALGIGFVYFLVSRNRVSPAYRSAVTMSAMICGIAAYHYWQMFNMFADDKPWNEGYRYADWLLTVPLLVAELVVVSGVAKEKAKGITTKLAVAALLMVAFGYPGETAEAGSNASMIYFVISMIFFIYILWNLFAGEVGQALKGQSGDIGTKLNNLRYVLLVTWAVYPIAYLLGDSESFLAKAFGLEVDQSQTVIQVGYTIADILSKPGYGVLILGIAIARSRAEGYKEA
ncbi:MAG: bacteriorhodopsin [Actinomycetota bacterium]|nr:bacteriorhodopsin [Actinomycetota bacterium]